MKLDFIQHLGRIPYRSSHLNLLREIIVTQFKMKEQGSVLGLLWSALTPLFMLLILYVVFNFHMKGTIDNYAIYLMIGLVIYTHFANSTMASMHVFKNMQALTANTVFPKELLVIATVASRSIEFCISFLICIGIAWLVGIELSKSVFLIPVVIIVQTAFALAVSLLLSIMYLFLKDIEHLYQLLLRLLFFLTPIFYDMSFLGEGVIRNVVLLNPLSHLAFFSRSAIFDQPILWNHLVIAIILTTFLLCISFWIFKRYEPVLAERV